MPVGKEPLQAGALYETDKRRNTAYVLHGAISSPLSCDLLCLLQIQPPREACWRPLMRLAWSSVWRLRLRPWQMR